MHVFRTDLQKKDGGFHPKPGPGILFAKPVMMNSTPMEDHALGKGLPHTCLLVMANKEERWAKGPLLLRNFI